MVYGRVRQQLMLLLDLRVREREILTHFVSEINQV